MTNEPTRRQDAANDHPETRERSNSPRVEARWEKPLIAASGGESTLLVRVIAPTDEVEISRPF